MNAELDDQFAEQSLFELWLDKIARKATKPANIAWSVGGVVAVGFVFSNALFFQDGKHPSAFFETRATSSQHSLLADEAEIEPQTASADEKKTITRIVLNDSAIARGQAKPLNETAAIPVQSEPVATLVPPQPSSRPNNNDVLVLQKLLAQLGFYKGTIDGLTGPQTDGAIKAYKAHVGLKGIELTVAELALSARNNLIVTSAIPTSRPVQPQTIPQRKVESVSYTPPIVRDAEPSNASKIDDAVAKVQAGLKAFGNAAVDVDGKMGPQTVSAIKEFQILFKLPASGQIDDQLLKKMTDVGLIN